VHKSYIGEHTGESLVAGAVTVLEPYAVFLLLGNTLWLVSCQCEAIAADIPGGLA
jgi:hypothetical protein